MLRRDLPVILFSAAYMVVFVGLSLTRQNYEFILYAAVVVALAAWILYKQRTVQFDSVTLWGLSLWGLLHMAGGNLRVGGGVLYNLQLIPVVLRYDQLVHAFGFGTATLACFHILRGMLRPDIVAPPAFRERDMGVTASHSPSPLGRGAGVRAGLDARPGCPGRFTLTILVILMGCGVGAINEIVEFIAVKLMPETNVGGYENTLWDLVFNLLGATVAATWASTSRFETRATAPIS